MADSSGGYVGRGGGAYGTGYAVGSARSSAARVNPAARNAYRAKLNGRR